MGFFAGFGFYEPTVVYIVWPGGVQPVVVQPGVGPGGAQAGQPLIGANPGEIRRKKNRDREQPSQPWWNYRFLIS